MHQNYARLIIDEKGSMYYMKLTKRYGKSWLTQFTDQIQTDKTYAW